MWPRATGCQGKRRSDKSLLCALLNISLPTHLRLCCSWLTEWLSRSDSTAHVSERPLIARFQNGHEEEFDLVVGMCAVAFDCPPVRLVLLSVFMWLLSRSRWPALHRQNIVLSSQVSLLGGLSDDTAVTGK